MYIREPFVAGRFYTRNRDELCAQIDSFIQQANVERSENVYALIAPHAGYIYSGTVAAHAYKRIAGANYDTAVVLAPSHYEHFDGVSVIPEGLFRTPIGDMEIDSGFTAELMKKREFRFIENAHIPEHSLEVQVPFIQRTIVSAKLVPIVLSNSSLDLMRLVGETIAQTASALNRKIMVILSTDLSHFHSYEDAVARDNKLIETLSKKDPALFKRVINEGYASACGEAAILAGMYYAASRGPFECNILKYANSGDSSGDHQRVVGYLAASFEKA